jgi:hypothetical protein
MGREGLRVLCECTEDCLVGFCMIRARRVLLLE